MAEHASSPHESSTSVALTPPRLTPASLSACFGQGHFQNGLLTGGKALLCSFGCVKCLSLSLSN